MIRKRLFSFVVDNNKFKKKTISETWLADTGTYPLIAVIPFTIIFGLGSGFYIMATTPDARIFKSSRKKFLRGDIKTI